MIDKRSVERFGLHLKAFVSADGENAAATKATGLITRDISMNGAYLLTDHPLPVGTRVKLDLVLSLDESKNRGAERALIKVSGEVLRAESDGMAICFDNNSKILPLSEGQLGSKM